MEWNNTEANIKETQPKEILHFYNNLFQTGLASFMHYAKCYNSQTPFKQSYCIKLHN